MAQKQEQKQRIKWEMILHANEHTPDDQITKQVSSCHYGHTHANSDNMQMKLEWSGDCT